MENILKKYITKPFLIPFIGGFILVLIYQMVNSVHYMGLGTEFIHEALVKMASFRDPILKSFFSSLTIASGFKGGEFIPLVFIGSTLGSALGARNLSDTKSPSKKESFTTQIKIHHF